MFGITVDTIEAQQNESKVQNSILNFGIARIEFFLTFRDHKEYTMKCARRVKLGKIIDMTIAQKY